VGPNEFPSVDWTKGMRETAIMVLSVTLLVGVICGVFLARGCDRYTIKIEQKEVSRAK